MRSYQDERKKEKSFSGRKEGVTWKREEGMSKYEIMEKKEAERREMKKVRRIQI